MVDAKVSTLTMTSQTSVSLPKVVLTRAGCVGIVTIEDLLKAGQFGVQGEVVRQWCYGDVAVRDDIDIGQVC